MTFIGDVDPIQSWWFSLLLACLPGLLVAFVGWFLQSRQQIRIQEQTDIRLDQQRQASERAQLQAFRFQTKFSHLHERQAIILARIYSLTVDLKIQVDWYTIVGETADPLAPQPPDENEWNNARKIVKKLRTYVERNAVYLNDDNKILSEQAVKGLASIAARFHSRIRRERVTGMVAENPDEDSYIGAGKEMKEIAEPLLKKLRTAFQKELGVEPPIL